VGAGLFDVIGDVVLVGKLLTEELKDGRLLKLEGKLL
jgi:hypothetical protein